MTDCLQQYTHICLSGLSGLPQINSAKSTSGTTRIGMIITVFAGNEKLPQQINLKQKNYFF